MCDSLWMCLELCFNDISFIPGRPGPCLLLEWHSTFQTIRRIQTRAGTCRKTALPQKMNVSCHARPKFLRPKFAALLPYPSLPTSSESEKYGAPSDSFTELLAKSAAVWPSSPVEIGSVRRQLPVGGTGWLQTA